MDLAMTNGFKELSANEMYDVEGGGIFAIVGLVLCVVLICGACKGCTDEAAK